MTRLLKLTALAIIVILLLARVPEVLTTPQFWADEGSSFFRDAWCHGSGSLFRHYCGYYHVIPRFIAWFVSFAPPLHAPALYIFASFLITAVVIALILSERLELPWKPLLALFVVLVPHDGEVFANMTNIQWILAFGLLVMVLMKPAKSGLVLAGDALYIALAGLTGPYVVTLLPVFAAKLLLCWRNRLARSRMILLSIVAAGASAIQMYSVQFTNEDKQFQYGSLAECFTDMFNHLGNLLSISVSRVFGSSMYSLIKLFKETEQQFDIGRITIFSIVISLIFAAMLAYDLQKNRDNRFAKLTFIYFAAVMLFAAFYRNKGLASSNLDQLIFTASDRYFYIPKVMFIWLLLLMSKRVWLNGLKMGFLVIILATTLQSFKREPWMDLNWKYWAPQISKTRHIQIPVNPIGWKIDMVCQQ